MCIRDRHGETVEYFWDSEGGTVFAHTAIRPDGSVEEQTGICRDRSMSQSFVCTPVA